MAAPPTEAIPRRTPWLAIGGLGAAVAVAVAIVVLLSPKDEPAPAALPEPPPAPRAAAPRAAPAAAPVPARDDSAAQKLFARAEATERSSPGDYEKAMKAWREVFAAHPGTAWAKRAEEKYRAASEALATFLEREFESARKGASALAAAGHFADAIEAVRAYQKEQPREDLRRRADAEIASLENQSRAAYNEAVREAQQLVKAGKVDEAAALLEIPAKGGIPEVAARGEAALAELRKLGGEARKALETGRTEEARRALREKAAPRMLAAVRARRYEEALRELDPAAPDPAVAEERAAIVAASQFWEAFLKAARGRTGQETALLLDGGGRLSGKLISVTTDRITLEGPAGTADAPLDKVHADQVVAWTIGKTLPSDDAATCVKAALFFFCEGNDEVARLYLATALEKGADIAPAERVFRSGFLRSASYKPPPPPPPKKK